MPTKAQLEQQIRTLSDQLVDANNALCQQEKVTEHCYNELDERNTEILELENRIKREAYKFARTNERSTQLLHEANILASAYMNVIRELSSR